MIVFIGLVILGVIIKFLYDKNQQSIQIGKQGGMLKKYKILNDYIINSHPSSKIFQETSDSITIGVSISGGTTTFRLLQSFGKLSVRWEMNSPFFGKHKLDWDFPEFQDQEKMLLRITNDLEKYQKNVIDASPYRNVIQ